MRIVFAGTPDFAVPALQSLFDARQDIAAVYTQPDRPAGRGRKLASGPIKQLAQRLGIPVEQPQSLRDEGATVRLAHYAPDVMVVVAYGLILPPAILQVPRHGCINIHASLLPRWRGAAPIHRAILAGDRQSGVSIMQMEAGLDTGPVYVQVPVEIAARETGGSLHDRLASLGAGAVVQVLEAIERSTARAQPQDASAATYAHKIEKSEARIDWTLPAPLIERKVRAFNPWPVAEARWRDEQLRIWSAHAVERGVDARPGTVLSSTAQEIAVACGEGALRLESVQLPGGRPVTAAAFLNSHDLRDAVLS